MVSKAGRRAEGRGWYGNVLFPLLRRMDAETAHERTIRALERAQSNALGRRVLRRIAGPVPARPVCLWGLTFPNVLGVAAGFDKDVRVVPGLTLLGFGHVEVGTITPWPQAGNPRPRVFRLPADRALINRMGFPNGGMVVAARRLRRLAGMRQALGGCIVGVSLGKQQATPLVEAASDYIAVMRSVFLFADYLALNISSPNTVGLRALQGRRYLEGMLAEVVAENRNLAYLHRTRPRPLLVKIAPDLTTAELDDILETALAAGVSGIIATNTTVQREGLVHSRQKEMGGLSGRPLRQRSTVIIDHICRRTGGQLPVIGVGGVSTAADVREKLDAGAVLVQVYTGLVYEGPGMAGRLLRALG